VAKNGFHNCPGLPDFTLLTAYQFQPFDCSWNDNGKDRLKIMPMFLDCTVYAGGPWFFPRILFVGE
jgi:hypothetical protein